MYKKDLSVFLKHILILFLSFLIPLIFFSSVQAVAHTASLSTSGDIEINISARPGEDAAAIGADTLTATTTCPLGYNLAIKSSGQSANLYLDGDSSSAATVLNPVSGTATLNTNQWGYSLTNNSVSGNFTGLTSTATSLGDGTLTSTLDGSDLFSDSATPASGDIIPIYYGVKISSTASPGTYEMENNGSIVYIMTVNPACSVYTIHYDANGGTGTMPDQHIYEGIPTDLSTNIFTRTDHVFIGWNTAADGSGTSYTDGQQVTDIANIMETVQLYAQWTDCPGGKICYNSNATSGVEGTMGRQDISATATEAMLLASNFSRTGYGFAGWNTKADGSGTNYGPNQTITFSAGQYNTIGLKLYAKWVAPVGNLQNWTGCSSLATGSVTALRDQRDNQVYAVAKLVDGNCWMIENLRLDNTATGNSNGSLAQGYHSSFIGLANPEDASVFLTNNTAANSLYSVDGSTAFTISGDYQASRFPRYNNTNTSARSINPASNNDSIYSYGHYYTWHAVIADTTNYTTNNTVIANTSICPSGWRLPRGGDKSVEANNDIWSLVVNGINNGVKPENYDSSASPNYTGNAEATPIAAALRSYPNNFIYSGLVYNNAFTSRGSGVNYWTSTNRNSGNTYYMSMSNTLIHPGMYSNIKIVGRTVRCLITP